MPNRTLCNVLDEMRKANKTRNYSGLLGLIEEAQSMGNRMESALYDKGDAESFADKKRRLKVQLRKSEKTLKTVRELVEESGNEELASRLGELYKIAKVSHWD